NIFIAGYFTGTVDFGGGALTSVGGLEMFLAKYSSTGTHLLSKRFGSTADDLAKSVAIDPFGNVLLTGTFRGNVSFGGATLTSDGTFQSPYYPGGPDVFIAKFDNNGSPIWSKNFTNTSGDEGYSIASDANGNIFLTGYYQGTIDFGGGILLQNGGSDIYLAKFSSAGVHLWSKHFGGTAADSGQALAVDSSGNV